ncbi:hypothetical protein MUB05_00135 [Acinetobacter indicus]|uniref:ATP-grasp domain-containing protein n=1 Tax=Acinetobacter TaxID=469 RepID=UPI0015D1B35D|nr:MULTISPECIES: hypothetical protein [Acinetobacter]MCP0915033.1 hypothetical protein [Acinetobacter indicus]MCP0918158.1 hypothetical protein [Acinetobacter indicus]MCP0920824.1 hypothetical protein [Acinetobacter indicus]
MKIAIHHNPNSFSVRWIKYCEKEKIEYKVVDAFDSNIIEQLKDFDIFMWHHHHAQYKDVLTAKRILFALEHAGIKVFPDFRTGWHFDDKVAQKYLLEAIKAPLVPSYVFYDKKQALAWAKNTSYPKVFKLKGGAGASNVKLVKNFNQASALIHKSFSKGFKQYDGIEALKEKIRKLKVGKENFKNVLKAFIRVFVPTDFSRRQPVERGYVYFQDFIPNNNSDIRVIVIGEKAFAIKRMVRENDFRASGSGDISFEPQEINIDCIKIAFEVNNKIDSQCVAFDFVLDSQNKPLIIEISYGFSMNAYDNCLGYWDSDLKWHNEQVSPQDWMIQNIIQSKT